MADQLLVHLIKQAQAEKDEDVKIIVTGTADDSPVYKGYIDIEKSNDKQVALKKIDDERDGRGPEDGPTYRFVVSSIRHVAYDGEHKGEPRHWFILEGDHSLSGVRISRDEFFDLTTRNKSGNGGNWPAGFSFMEKRPHIYLKAVRFDRPIVSEDIVLDLDEVNCCGDRG